MNHSLLHQSLKQAFIIKKGTYPYLIHPLLDGIPEIPPQLLHEVVSVMKEQITPYLPFDKIVTIEAMGIPIASLLSIELNSPLTIIRKRKYGFKDEHMVQQQTGYVSSKLYINGLKKDDQVIIVDDVVSTGQTLQTVIKKLQELKINVKGVFLIVDKGSMAYKLEEEMHIPFFALSTIELINDHVQIIK
jgi:adenine phosphoribosyltransferase